MKSIIEETGVEAIDAQDDGIVRSKEGFIFNIFFVFDIINPQFSLFECVNMCCFCR